MTNLYDAHRQWYSRPPDERFADLDSMLAYTQRLKTASRESVRNLCSVHVDVTDRLGIALNGDEAPALTTNWSFNQLCTAIGAPAKYLRSLPPHVVRECLQFGLGNRDAEVKLLRRNTEEEGTISALTGPNYGRIWDADVVATLQDAVAGTGWHVPPARSNGQSENAGLYASDRDMFAFMISDEPPIEIGNAKLGRGFFIWNSETGSATFGLTTFLYNYVCGNHVVWGAEDVNELKIVHRTKAPERFCADAIPVLNQFVESRTVGSTIRDVVGRAMREKLGDNLESVVTRLSSQQFTKKEITDAWQWGIDEGEDPTTRWGLVQGLTAYARTFKHIDARVDLERRAGNLLIPTN